MSCIVPNELVKVGIVKGDMWLNGVVVRLRDRKPQNALSGASSKEPSSGKWGSKGKKKKERDGKGDSSRAVSYTHLTLPTKA